MSTVEERQRARDRAADSIARTDEVRIRRTRELHEGWPSKLVGGNAAERKRRQRARAKARTTSGDSDLGGPT